ncbi:MAG: ComEA family DNA-binding protein [Runella zeae]
MLRRLILLIRDEFGVSKSQARAFLVVATLMVASWSLPLVYDRLLDNEGLVIQPQDIQKADSLVAMLEKSQVLSKSYPSYTAKNYPKETQGNPEQPLTLFYFDPNLATVEQFQALGMPRFIAERIEKYRSKGGKFRKKEDLQKIYGLQPALYEKLEPYISLAKEESKPQNQAILTSAAEVATVEVPPKSNHFSKPVEVVFDINTADTTQLIRLKGIGGKLAARIVKFRDGLGGFVSETQFSEVFGLDSLALGELNRLARVKSPVKKININTASPEDLDRHPYLSRRQSEVIVRYREQHGAFQSEEDLLKIKILDEKLVSKIAPYLTF